MAYFPGKMGKIGSIRESWQSSHGKLHPAFLVLFLPLHILPKSQSHLSAPMPSIEGNLVNIRQSSFISKEKKILLEK